MVQRIEHSAWGEGMRLEAGRASWKRWKSHHKNNSCTRYTWDMLYISHIWDICVSLYIYCTWDMLYIYYKGGLLVTSLAQCLAHSDAQIKAALMLLWSLHHHHLDHFAEIKMATSQLYNIFQLNSSSKGVDLWYVFKKQNNRNQKILIFCWLGQKLPLGMINLYLFRKNWI